MFFSSFLAQSNNFLPNPNDFCPTGGCKLLNPEDFPAGLPGITAMAVNIASIMTYVIGSLAIIMFVYAAFLFLLGGDKGAEKGRKVIINSIIAIFIAAFSFTAVRYLISFLNEFRI